MANAVEILESFWATKEVEVNEGMSVPFQRICAVTVQIGFSSTITDLESSHAFLLVSRVAVEMEAPVAPIAGILWAQVKVPGCAGREGRSQPRQRMCLSVNRST
jgi:hypothetical protein